MQALPKKFTGITQNVAPVYRWLTNQRYRVTNEAAKIEAPGGGWILVLWISTFLWACVMAIVAGFAGDSADHQTIHWTPWATAWLTGNGIGFVLAIFWTIIHGVSTDKLRDETRAKLELELVSGNTLAQRAELITKAVKDFEFHCSRYRELRNQVDEELVEEDPAAAERYLVFLDRAYEVLRQAIRNFTVVSERVAREEQHLTNHPELKEASLTLLLDELKADVERPEFLTTLADPMRALAHEEALGEVVRELGQHGVPA